MKNDVSESKRVTGIRMLDGDGVGVKNEVMKTVFVVRNDKRTTWAEMAGDENMMVRGENAEVKESQKSL